MKTYNEYIVEKQSFKKRFLEIERRYPNAQMFMSIASRWILKARLIKDKELKRLLIKLKRKTDIMNFSQKDFRRITDFINKRGLHDIESVRNLFYNEGGDMEREETDSDKKLKAAEKEYEKTYKEMENFVDNL